MFPSPALSPTAALPVPGTVPAGEPGGEPSGADFLTILAQSVDQAATIGEAAVDPVAALTAPAPDPAAAIMAASTGKILPPALPVAAVPQEPAAPEAEALPGAAPAKVIIQTLAHQFKPGAALRALPKKGEAAEAPLPGSADPAAPEAIEAAIAVIADPAAPAPLLPAMALPSQVAPAAQAHRPAEPGKSEDAPGQLVRLQVPALDGRHTDHRTPPLPALARIARQISSDAPPPNPPEAQPQAAPLPITQVRIEVALPPPLKAAQSAPVRALAATASLLREDADPDTAALLPIAAPQAASAQPVASQPATPLTRPHDFAALIDRLSAAREAAAPQSVSVSLPHADFGRVQLHFRQDDAGLAVSLTSSDPDFARVAAQAAPPVLPVGEARSADTANQQTGTRSDGQGAQASQNGGQRGQSQDRRSDASARFEHQPRSRAASDAPGRGDQRSGIFA